MNKRQRKKDFINHGNIISKVETVYYHDYPITRVIYSVPKNINRQLWLEHRKPKQLLNISSVFGSLKSKKKIDKFLRNYESSCGRLKLQPPSQEFKKYNCKTFTFNRESEDK